MMIMFYATSLFLAAFHANINTTTATSTIKTTGQSLDDSILKLQQNIQRLTNSTQDLENEYKALNNEVIRLKKLHEPCEPCKASTKGKNICDCTGIKARKDCLEFYQNGYKMNGVYRLKGPGFHTLHVYCDQTTDGGGWTLFQRRQDGSVDFSRKWKDYKVGFGNLEGEFWLGNENIHDLTEPSFAPKKSQLLINMKMKGKKETEYVKYETFEITGQTTKYVLKINGFSGNVTERPKGLDYNNNMEFTTIDSDNDKRMGDNCANRYAGGGGWWYNSCSYVWLNAPYKFTSTRSFGKIMWFYTSNSQPKFVELKMRRNL